VLATDVERNVAFDLRGSWQVRAIGEAKGQTWMVLLSVLAHTYDAALLVMMEIVYPDFDGSIPAPHLTTAAKIDNGRNVVVACSALKRTYRDILIRGRRDIRIVYLKGSRELMSGRLKGRKGHFINPSLLDSQFNVLEEPAFDEPALTVEADRPVDAIVRDILDKLDQYQPVGD